MKLSKKETNFFYGPSYVARSVYVSLAVFWISKWGTLTDFNFEIQRPDYYRLKFVRLKSYSIELATTRFADWATTMTAPILRLRNPMRISNRLIQFRARIWWIWFHGDRQLVRQSPPVKTNLRSSQQSSPIPFDSRLVHKFIRPTSRTTRETAVNTFETWKCWLWSNGDLRIFIRLQKIQIGLTD